MHAALAKEAQYLAGRLLVAVSKKPCPISKGARIGKGHGSTRSTDLDTDSCMAAGGWRAGSGGIEGASAGAGTDEE